MRMSSSICGMMGTFTMSQGDYKLFEGADFNSWIFRQITPKAEGPNSNNPLPYPTANDVHHPLDIHHPLLATSVDENLDYHHHPHRSLPRPILKSPEPCVWNGSGGNCDVDAVADSLFTPTSVANNIVISRQDVPSSPPRLPGSPPLMQGSPSRARNRSRSLSCSSGGSNEGNTLYCVFCKRNGETREFFTTHTLKDWRGVVVCPVLRAYTCPRCGSTGDYAHTESHCPLFGPQPSLMASLRTRRSSCGFRVKYSHR